MDTMTTVNSSEAGNLNTDAATECNAEWREILCGAAGHYRIEEVVKPSRTNRTEPDDN